MKCPYIIDETGQTNTDIYEYDEHGICIAHKHMLIEQHVLMDCLKKKCAAWHKGRCKYRGAVN